MKLTKSRLRQLIQEELQAVLREQTEEDLSYLSRLESGMSPEELSLLSLGLDPNLAPPRPLDPPELPSAIDEPPHLKAFRQMKAKERADAAAAAERILGPGPAGPSREQVRQELLWRAMKRGSK